MREENQVGWVQALSYEKSFCVLALEKKGTPSPHAFFFFVKLEGAFCLINSPEIHLGFDW